MKAMILAAGRGERMRPLTDTLPKPLIQVDGIPLIVRLIQQLASAGIKELVVNLAYRGQQIRDYLGTGAQWGVTIAYSDEGSQALETAGGIRRAIDLLGDNPFLVVNGDVATDYPFGDIHFFAGQENSLAHLILVNNPEFKPKGDFGLAGNRVLPIEAVADEGWTFSGIGLYQPALFTALEDGPAALGPLLKEAARLGKISGDLYSGFWMDIGTPDRLDQYQQYLKS